MTVAEFPGHRERCGNNRPDTVLCTLSSGMNVSLKALGKSSMPQRVVTER